MRQTLIIIVVLISIGIGALIWSMQTQKQLTVHWDAMPVDQTWTEVRVYDITQTPELLMGTVACAAGPPIGCPVEVTVTVQKRPYQLVARSWDGTWESDNSNVVVLAGPPKAPTGLIKK